MARMRLRSGLVVAAAVAVLLPTLPAVLPSVIAAEAEESCGVGTLTGAQEPPPIPWEVGIAGESSGTWVPPFAPVGKEPPASDFTAIANWGDGSTAPAKIVKENCGYDV